MAHLIPPYKKWHVSFLSSTLRSRTGLTLAFRMLFPREGIHTSPKHLALSYLQPTPTCPLFALSPSISLCVNWPLVCPATCLSLPETSLLFWFLSKLMSSSCLLALWDSGLPILFAPVFWSRDFYVRLGIHIFISSVSCLCPSVDLELVISGLVSACFLVICRLVSWLSMVVLHLFCICFAVVFFRLSLSFFLLQQAFSNSSRCLGS